jgi:hypothetical protein
MKKNLRSIITALTLCISALSIHAQDLKDCSGKTHWIFKQEHGLLGITPNGKISKSDSRKIIHVDNYDLQCVIVSKSTYAKEEDNTDLKVLTRYAMAEIAWQSDQMKSKLMLNAHKEELASGKSILIWSFEMPEGSSKDVLNQVYANMVVGDKIFGLGCPRYKEQSMKEIKKFLIETISTLKEYKKEKEVCKE